MAKETRAQRLWRQPRTAFSFVMVYWDMACNHEHCNSADRYTFLQDMCLLSTASLDCAQAVGAWLGASTYSSSSSLQKCQSCYNLFPGTRAAMRKSYCKGQCPLPRFILKSQHNKRITWYSIFPCQCDCLEAVPPDAHVTRDARARGSASRCKNAYALGIFPQ